MTRQAWQDWQDDVVYEIAISHRTASGKDAVFYIHPEGGASLGAVLEALNVDTSEVIEK